MSHPQPPVGKSDRPRTPGVWRVMAGFVVWAAAFVVLYAGHALGCLHVPSRLAPASLATLLIILWAVHLVACSALAWRSGRHICTARRSVCGAAQARFMWRATFLTDSLALLSVLVTGLPFLAFPVCQA